MPRYIRIQTYVVGRLGVIELDDGEGIIAASSDGERVAVVTAHDVTVADPDDPNTLPPMTAAQWIAYLQAHPESMPNGGPVDGG